MVVHEFGIVKQAENLEEDYVVCMEKPSKPWAHAFEMVTKDRVFLLFSESPDIVSQIVFKLQKMIQQRNSKASVRHE